MGGKHGTLALLLAMACGGLDQAQSQGAGTEASTSDTPVGADTTSLGGEAGHADGSAGGDSDSDSGRHSGKDSGDATTGDEPTALGPPYPLVLAHGFFGFDELGGIAAADYFFEVAPALAGVGETLVFTPAVDPFNDSTTRGEQLLAHIETIVAQTGHDKVVIIGHSQGGLDARVVASLRPDLVAAVVTVATPHHGTPVADVALGLVADPGAQALVDALVNAFGAGVWDTVDGGSSLAASMQQMSQPGISAFNATYPDAPGVRYVSIAGRSSLASGGEACAVADAPPLVAQWADERDPIDPLFATTAAFLTGANALDPVRNDGLVRVLDARWGEFLGCIPADHTDQIGQVFGDPPGVGNAWRHHDFWIALSQWVRAQGL